MLAAGATAAQPSDDEGRSRDEGASRCRLEGAESRTVVRVVDGETLQLDGGSEVRLLGALSPRPYDAASPLTDWPLADQARIALDQLVSGRSVQLEFAGRRTDRYGRLLAHVFIGSDGAMERIWIQGEMLKRGLARAYGLEDGTHCLVELIANEAVAREAGLGLWAEAAYAVRTADETRTLLRLAGTYQLVEGKVHRISELRGTLYVNFGEDWRQDFTVVMRGQARRAMSAAGLGGDELAGRRVRVRGWIERRGGPLVELAHPSALEVLAPVEAPEAASVAAGKATTSRRRARQRYGLKP